MQRDKDTERIARRHPDIKQDALFGLPPAGMEHKAGTRRETPRDERQSQRSVRTATCPKCGRFSNSKVKIGVLRVFDPERKREREVFRDHDKFTRNGTRIHCPGSGMDAPPS